MRHPADFFPQFLNSQAHCSRCVSTTLFQVAPSARNQKIIDVFSVASPSGIGNHMVNVPASPAVICKRPTVPAQMTLAFAAAENSAKLIRRKPLFTLKNGDGSRQGGLIFRGRLRTLSRSKQDNGEFVVIVIFTRVSPRVPIVNHTVRQNRKKVPRSTNFAHQVGTLNRFWRQRNDQSNRSPGATQARQNGKEKSSTSHRHNYTPRWSTLQMSRVIHALTDFDLWPIDRLRPPSCSKGSRLAIVSGPARSSETRP